MAQLRYNAITRDPFDQNPYLFCFTNRVFDIQNSNFVAVNKYDYCQMTCGKEWNDYTTEEIRKVAGIFEDVFPDQELRRGYISVLKSGFTGVRPEHFTMANGTGRNGKGLINEHTVNACGSYAKGDAHLELLTKPTKSGPNVELAELHRIRLIVYSEPEDGLGEAIRLSNIKKQTGNAEGNARMCHSNHTKVEQHGTILFECNKLPIILGDKGDSAM